LRIVFLLGGWREGIEITDAMVKEGSAWEDRLNNFFIKAKDISEDTQKDTEGDQNLLESLEKAKNDTFAALCNSFDTPTVMRRISDLISDYNIAYNSTDNPPPSPSTTLSIARWMTSVVNTFGLNGTAKPEDPKIGWSGIDVPEDAKPILTSLSRKRDSLRRKARSKGIAKQDLTPVPYPERTMTEAQLKSESPFKGILERFNKTLQDLNDSQTLAKDVLQLTDRLRDTDLWDKDVYLEDRDNDAPALIRPVTKELRAAREEKERRAREKEEAKLKKEQAKKEEAPKTDKGEQDHMTMFRTGEYSAWDADGIPTKDKDGEELTKSRRKKLAKDWEKQKKAHEAFLAKGK
jgi:cysteinyl-tRNA synthetase